MSGSDPLVRVEHIRAAGHCASGARKWFAAHELSWSDFVTDGLPASVLDATGDAMAFEVTKIAREMESGG